MENPFTVVLRNCTLAVATIMITAPSAWAHAPQLEGYPCAPMRWEGDEDQPRIALSTPVRVNGRRYRFQFDTGAWPNILYGDESDRRGWTAPSNASLLSRSFEAGGASLEGVGARLSIRRDIARGDPDGTLGLSSLVGKLTVMDYRVAD